MKSAKRFLSILLTLSMVLGLLPMSAFAAKNNTPFTDVSTGDWFYESVEYVYECGMMSGTGETTFSPQTTTTRGMIVTILHRMEGTPEAAGVAFNDVDELAYYADAVAWASENGIVGGYGNGKFGPNDPITREQMAAILYRFAQYLGMDVNVGEDTNILSYGDAEQVSEWAVEALQWAVGMGLINGIDGKLVPQGSATRAQVATILMRFCEGGVVAEDTHTVTFQYNYGSKGVYQEIQVADGDTVDKPDNPDRKNHTFKGWYTAKSGGEKYNFNLPVTGDITLWAKWKTKDAYYTVTFDPNGENVQNLPAPQSLKSGDILTSPEAPSREGYVFSVWCEDETCSTVFDGFEEVVEQDKTLYALWISEDDIGDSDQDGLEDYFEDLIGTDKWEIDTDQDGLTDFQEYYEVFTDSLKRDTDDDGTFDGDEDYDYDSLSNLFEYANNLSPVLKDTDCDGLYDGEELETYNTNPTLEDTDDDGATDGVEVAYGTNPLVAESTFVQEAESEDVSEDNPVAASVVAKVPGGALGTVSVTSVSYISNPIMSQSLAGSLGYAYEFTASEGIESANITFEYDTSLGEIGKDFQPRIYYFNESTQELEELPNQTVKAGSVSVTVDHFSTYVLLNKVEFDRVWETEIKPPNATADNTELDIVFVVDYSYSMVENDSKQLFKTLSKEFISKLREGRDQAAVVKFIRKATVVSDLTGDQAKLSAAIESISYDNGYGSYSGTDGSTGIRKALDVLSGSDAGYKYVVHITDGEDTQKQYSYDTLISEAASNDIVIYTIGMGSASESILKKIAAETNGKYYHATTDSTSDEIGLDEVFDEIENETIDYTTDSNGDLISDYYTQVILEGKLLTGVTSSQFVGYDFSVDSSGNPSDDWDGDGLKNGEEIFVTERNGKVYIRMYSDPTEIDSDFDGKTDKFEYLAGSNPLKHSYDVSAVNGLMNDDMYCAYLLKDKYDSSLATQLVINTIAALSFNADPTESCKQLYLDYFYDYATSSVDDISDELENQILIENINSAANEINKVISGIKTGKEYGFDKPAEVLQELYILRSELKTITKRIAVLEGDPTQTKRLENLTDAYLEVSKKMSSYGIINKFSVKVTDYANKYQHLMNKKNFTGMKNSTTISAATSVFATAVDVADTVESYAKLKANESAFAENLDILAYASQHGERLSTRSAAEQIFDVVSNQFEDYGNQVKSAVLKDVLNGGTQFAVSQLVKLNPYTNAIKETYDLMDLLLGFSHKAKTIQNALALNTLVLSTSEMASSLLEYTNLSYDCKYSSTEETDRYLTHLAQLRIVGEKEFVNYSKNTGLITMFFQGGYTEAKIYCTSMVEWVWGYAEDLALTLSSKLPKKF